MNFIYLRGRGEGPGDCCLCCDKSSRLKSFEKLSRFSLSFNDGDMFAQHLTPTNRKDFFPVLVRGLISLNCAFVRNLVFWSWLITENIPSNAGGLYLYARECMNLPVSWMYKLDKLSIFEPRGF